MDESIPREQWRAFFRDFAAEHAGWLVQMYEDPPGPEGAPVLELVDIVCVEPARVTVTARDAHGEAIRDTLDDVVGVQAEMRASGDERGVHLTSASGRVLKVRFRTSPRQVEPEGFE